MSAPIDPKIVESLILSGAIEVGGMSEDGYMTYKFTKDAKEIVPDLYNSYIEGFYSDLMSLWAKGFISMDVTEANPTVNIIASKFTNQEEMDKLTESEKKSLNFFVDALRDK